MLRVTSFEAARDALRNRALRQALYDEGQALMGTVIVNLHGPDHTARRRLENRLFTPTDVGWFERERMPAIIRDVLASCRSDEPLDLLPLARRIMMWLSIDVAGVDLPEAGDPAAGEAVDGDRAAGDPAARDAAFERLFALMHRLSRASVVVHATGDKAEIIDDGNRALAAFEREFFRPSFDRRSALIADGLEPPNDVLSTLIVNDDRLELSDHDVLRETAYYPWVGSHSTAAQFVHAMHHVLEWLDDRPGDRRRLMDDADWRLRFVHESLRLHPASPVAVRRAVEPTTVDGVEIGRDDDVTISIEAANRDPVFGLDPDAFMPDRSIPHDVPRWGLSFGSGMHACLGRELAGGRTADAGHEPLQGAVSMLIAELLRRNVRRDPEHQARLDTTTTRTMWAAYPVRLGAADDR